MVVESGSGVTHCVPVFEGYALPHGIIRSTFAGQTLTEQFGKLAFGSSANSFAPEVLRDMKEKLCSVSTDYARASRHRIKDHAYALPDGTVVNVPGMACIKAPEMLFTPSLMDGSVEHQSIADLTRTAINKCDDELQTDLYSTIVLAGGTTMLPGFSDRLEKEIRAKAPAGKAVAVLPDSQRKNAAWIGGSMFASLPTFDQIQITRAEYEDGKEAVIHRKCF